MIPRVISDAEAAQAVSQLGAQQGVPAYLQKAAKKAAAAAGKRSAAGKTIGKTITKSPAMGAFLKGLSTKHPVLTGIGGVILLQLLMDRIMKHTGDEGARGVQEAAINQGMESSPDDMYYQAMAGDLSGDRRQAQDALLAAILQGRGQTLLAKGERAVGTGNAGAGYYGGF